MDARLGCFEECRAGSESNTLGSSLHTLAQQRRQHSLECLRACIRAVNGAKRFRAQLNSGHAVFWIVGGHHPVARGVLSRMVTYGYLERVGHKKPDDSWPDWVEYEVTIEGREALNGG